MMPQAPLEGLPYEISINPTPPIRGSETHK